MSLFGKKEDKPVEVEVPVTPDVGNPVEEKPQEETPLTPEQKLENEAKKLLITMYADGRLKVEGVQNITHRADAEFLVSRAKDEYERGSIANLTAMILMQTLSKKDKGKDIWLPGAR